MIKLKMLPSFFLLFSVLAMAACAPIANTPTGSPPTSFSEVPADQVSIYESSVTWDTYRYALTEDGSFLLDSFDGKTIIQRTFKTWVMENKYLKITLLPEMGGRILSIFYKPTGHEELYQNPVGVPYEIGKGTFYYNWIIVYGGIFPTFPEPEHGKSWLQPWNFQIVSQSAQAVTVRMSLIDDIDSSAAPSRYNVGKTGLQVNYDVTLTAGRAAVDAVVEIVNPSADPVKRYEYWTNTTLAPGSEPGDTKTTAGAELIIPVEKIKIPSAWGRLAVKEEFGGGANVYNFKTLRNFKDWPDMGIAYAYPDMQERNFWGVINHDNEEGIFRIADNRLTPGLKIWTWGYPVSSSIDPQTSISAYRPYIELWAGVTREFWQRTEFPARGRLVIPETYGPSVGLSNVTHASVDFLINFSAKNNAEVQCQLFGLNPDQAVQVALELDGTPLSSRKISLDPAHASDCSAQALEMTSGKLLKLMIRNQLGELLFEADLPLARP
jgi:hypothetical protein